MLRIYKNLSRKDTLLTLIAVGFIALHSWLELRLPDYMARITTLVQSEGSLMSAVLEAGGRMLLCAFGSLLCGATVSVLSGRVATDFGATLRDRMFTKVQSFSMEEIGRFSTASLITRSTNDVTQVQFLIVMGLQAMVKAPIMAALAIGKISSKSWQWTTATAVAVLILLAGVALVIGVVMPRFKLLQKLTDQLNRVTRENLNGLRVVRAYNAEEYQQSKFAAVNDELTRTHLFTGRIMGALSPGIQMLASGLTLSVYWIGAALIQSAGMTEKLGLFSDMVVFSQYAMQVVMSFMMLVMIFIMLPRASVSAKRILEVLDTPLTIADGDKPAPTEKNGTVEFRNVCFRYPDAADDVLHDISFVAGKGETVAFIGATGCGKSTAMNLIPRFYDAGSGEVLVDGMNVRDYKQTDLRKRIAYISQKATLFGGNVRSNIAFGDMHEGNTDDGRIIAAIDTAQASDFVGELEGGIDGFVAQGGDNLSGGQKQRLSIARALFRNAEIIIFDDSFSALDYRTDRILRNALKEQCADATKLIVAQRIGTIRDADRIVVLDEGRVAGIGTHKELMENCEVYRQIAYSQLSEEELA